MNKQTKKASEKARKQGNNKARKKEGRTEKRRTTMTIMLIIWRTCRLWLHTEWSVQMDDISTYINDLPKWSMHKSDWSWKMATICTRLWRFFSNALFCWSLPSLLPDLSAGLIQIRGCSADAHRASWRKTSGFWEAPRKFEQFFRCGKRWRKCGDARHGLDKYGTRHGFVGDIFNLYPMYV